MHEWPDAHCARAQTGRPDVQETRETLDPQRQHAQLLGLWSQGSKALRRLNHFGYLNRAAFAQTERWWNLARQWEERGVMVRLLPVVPPAGLLKWGSGTDEWSTVIDAGELDRYSTAIYRHPLGIDFRPRADAVTMSADGPTIFAATLCRRLSASLVHTAGMLSRRAGLDLRLVEVDHALEVLAAWRQVPRAMARVAPEDWAAAAHLWRHRSQAMVVAGDLASRYPWIEASGGGRQRWTSPG